MKKRIINSAAVITVVIVLVLGNAIMANAVNDSTPSLSNFARQSTYASGLFSDVSSSAWYAENVAIAYELGLVNGTSANTFGVSSNITIAETITLAARLDSIFYTGNAAFSQSDPWYQIYVDYALENEIIFEDEYVDYNAIATRAQFATILSRALPSYVLEEINWIEDNAIPDVKTTDSYGDSVYMLYRAGILTGSDTEGTFNPQNSISRPEVAIIVTRMADTSLRQSITLVGEY